MMSRHFALNSELTGAITKILPHANNQLSAPGSFFNHFVTDIYIYTVEPVLNGHPRDWTKLAVIHRWLLYTGNCFNHQKVSTEINIKFLEIYYFK